MNQIINCNKGNFLSMAKVVSLAYAVAWAKAIGISTTQIQLWTIQGSK